MLPDYGIGETGPLSECALSSTSLNLLGSMEHQVDNRSPAEKNEATRVRRLREDARRPLSVNLAETIALSHALIKMAGAARRR